MKKVSKTILPFFVGGLLSVFGCQEDAALELAADQSGVYGVSIGPTVRQHATEPFTIRFTKPNPCEPVRETKVSATGLTVNYNVILETGVSPCPTVTTRQDSTQTTFAAAVTGTYTLNFLLNNRLFLVRKVTVVP